jgi:hypothetical protein
VEAMGAGRADGDRERGRELRRGGEGKGSEEGGLPSVAAALTGHAASSSHNYSSSTPSFVCCAATGIPQHRARKNICCRLMEGGGGVLSQAS